MNLTFSITVSGTDGPHSLHGRHTLVQGENHIVPELPAGTLQSATAELPLIISQDEKIFMNGYQTWTYCPEYRADSRIRGLHGLPKAIIRRYSLDRYGDYNFTDYPNRRGVTHGVSYCYFRLGAHYRLLASLDETAGYTQLRYDANLGILTITRDCAGLRCGGTFHAFDLFYAEGSEDEVFDAWFRAMKLQPRTRKKLAGYSSWYNRYEKIDQAAILSDLSGCRTLLQAGDLFQIDDGWEQAVGDWEPDGRKFPDGMKALADRAHEAGFLAGLWLAPFGCQESSRIFREHPDWMVQKDGQPYRSGCNWGGFYSLDIDNPEAVRYLEAVFDRVLNEWGFDLVKLDFLYGAAPFGSESESRAARMQRAMELLRRLCGEKLILGCGVPLMPSFGLVDYCRIGCDVSLDWDDKFYMRWIHRERVSTRQAIGNTIFRRQLNGRAFGSDPDVFFLRTENCKLTQEQKAALGTVNALFSGILLTSDDPAAYTPAQREQYQALMRLRNAGNIRVESGGGLRVHYTLDGQDHTVMIPE